MTAANSGVKLPLSKRVFIASIAPLFENQVYGGSQAILQSIAVGLAEHGATVDLVCSRRPENENGFRWHERAVVHPLLRLTGAFPDPYEVPPGDIARSARDIAPLMDAADVVYLHADIFHLRRLIPKNTPIIRSFHDFAFETALISAFGYCADLTIVPSRYLGRSINATVGESGMRNVEPVVVIPNGIDTRRFAAAKSSTSAPDDTLRMLFPHRPDERKGIFECLNLARSLRDARRGLELELIIPKHIDADRLPGLKQIQTSIESRAQELGVQDVIRYVPWQTSDQMPDFYISGDITLCLGDAIEAFGLAPYESIAAGTPVVVSRVGAYREIPSHSNIEMIEWGDGQAALTAVLRQLDMGFNSATVDPLPGEYQQDLMIERYVEFLLRPEESIQRYQSATSGIVAPDAVMLAPWCHPVTGGIYDDYHYGVRQLHGLSDFLCGRESAMPFDLDELLNHGVDKEEIAAARDLSVLVSEFREPDLAYL
jgi:glycosyltransferase involved in cell wall biosynthesis